MIPLEVGLPTLRVMQVEVGGNDVALEEALNFVDEKGKWPLFGWLIINKAYPNKGIVN